MGRTRCRYHCYVWQEFEAGRWPKADEETRRMCSGNVVLMCPHCGWVPKVSNDPFHQGPHFLMNVMSDDQVWMSQTAHRWFHYNGK